MRFLPLALVLSLAMPLRAQDALAPTPALPVESPEKPAEKPDAPKNRGRDPYAGKSEQDALAALRSLEARLSLGHAPSSAEANDVMAASTGSPHISVRALAVAVLAWLDPATAATPLLKAWNDDEPRVRAGAAQSLLSLARRLADDDRRRVVADGLGHLDDPSNEVACATVEPD